MYWIIAFCAFVVQANVSFWNNWKVQPWYPWLLGSISFIAGLMWGFITQDMDDDTRQTVVGVYWDVMITSIYVLIPVLFYGASLTPRQIMGVLLVILGVLNLH